MENLINKIKEYTKDGSPGVGQLIELGDLAKAHGVKKNELEKLIDAAIKQKSAANEEVKEQENNIEETQVFDEFANEKSELFDENPRMDNYVRPDYDKARDSSDIEMKLRQEEEKQKLDDNISIEFEQSDIVFPELNVTFGNEKAEEIKMPDIELPEIHQQEELVSEFTVPTMETSKDVKFEEVRIEPKKEVVNNNFIYEPPKEKFENFDEPESDFTMTENGIKVLSFEDTKAQQKEQEAKEDLLRKIIADNKAAREKVDNEEKTSDFSKSKQTSAKSTETVTLQQSGSAKTTGIIALIASITPLTFIGLIAGLYGYSVAKKYKLILDSNSNIYGTKIISNINTAYYTTIAAIVIASLKMVFGFLGFLF